MQKGYENVQGWLGIIMGDKVKYSQIKLKIRILFLHFLAKTAKLIFIFIIKIKIKISLISFEKYLYFF